MKPVAVAPAPLSRPKLATYLFERDITFRAAGEALGQSQEWVRLVCLPFDDPRRRVPHKDVMERIVAWTQGAVVPADFYPAHLNQGSTFTDPAVALPEAP